MPTSSEAVYLDSSALVKLVVDEPESLALLTFLRAHSSRVSSALVLVEVVRAVRRQDPRAVVRARRLVRRLRLLELDDAVLGFAADVAPPLLRSLDAIHLASAVTLGSALRYLVTYDQRLAEAAISLGLPVASPRT